jgi:streptomycin 6-kinase
MLDIPGEVRTKVVVDGHAAWLDELPAMVESLAQEWSLTLGATLRGGHAAFVAGVTLRDGSAAVLKVGVPGTRRAITREAAVLGLAGGDGCVRLRRHDLDRNALLLERLGAALLDVVPDPAARHDIMGDVAARLWRPVGSDVDLPTGADKARECAGLLPRLWEETGRPCSEATVADALACADRRRRAHDDRQAVLVHGDVHDLNVLRASDGTFELIDPAGLRPRHDHPLQSGRR